MPCCFTFYKEKKIPGSLEGQHYTDKIGYFFSHGPLRWAGGENEVVTTKKKFSHITAPYLWETFSIVISHSRLFEVRASLGQQSLSLRRFAFVQKIFETKKCSPVPVIFLGNGFFFFEVSWTKTVWLSTLENACAGTSIYFATGQLGIFPLSQ